MSAVRSDRHWLMTDESRAEMTEAIGSQRMSALVVNESMYGNTGSIVRAIAEGIENVMPVTAVNMNHALTSSLLAIDLLVVGAPTHVHGLSRPNSRAAAISSASAELPLDIDAVGTGVREWLAEIETSARCFAPILSYVVTDQVLLTSGSRSRTGHNGQAVGDIGGFQRRNAYSLASRARAKQYSPYAITPIPTATRITPPNGNPSSAFNAPSSPVA